MGCFSFWNLGSFVLLCC